ncbi:MAG TPA: hypothetical protein PKN99_06045 [Cyclobacteriaceae bacterium]|nr:hypothetical protein [Cyclobacteriaceae bacterium]
MHLHIVHLKHRQDRLSQVLRELEIQIFDNYVLWEGFLDTEKPSRGIAEAHNQIVSWASEQGLQEVMIAEDDVQFSAKGALEYFINNEPDDYDLYLGGISYGKVQDDNSVKDFAGTHLYKIRQRFYKTFLSLSGNKDIDRALARQGKFLVCNPMVARQRNGFSDNRQEYINNDLYFNKRNLWKGYK